MRFFKVWWAYWPPSCNRKRLSSRRVVLREKGLRIGWFVVDEIGTIYTPADLTNAEALFMYW